LGIFVALRPEPGLQEYNSVPSPPAVVPKETGLPEQTETPPPVMATVGSASVIPVKTEDSPEVNGAFDTVNVLGLSIAYLTQGLEDWLKVPLNWALLINVVLPPATSDVGSNVPLILAVAPVTPVCVIVQ
jgi:hypothetical protein